MVKTATIGNIFMIMDEVLERYFKRRIFLTVSAIIKAFGHLLCKKTYRTENDNK